MSFPYDHPAREAERLRIIVETLAYTNPGMTMDEAKTVIPEIEKRTAKLEAPERPNGFITLPDSEPETIAKFIDLQPDIQDHIPTRKINAIKETRARTFLGLKETKEGVEHWDRTRNAAAAWAGSSSPLNETVAKWIDGQSAIQDHILEAPGMDRLGRKHSRITGIKDVRLGCSAASGLKEAKDGVDHWLRTRRLPKTP